MRSRRLLQSFLFCVYELSITYLCFITVDIHEAAKRLACVALGKHHEMSPEDYELAVMQRVKPVDELSGKVNECVPMLQQEDCVMCIVPHAISSSDDEPEPEQGATDGAVEGQLASVVLQFEVTTAETRSKETVFDVQLVEYDVGFEITAGNFDAFQTKILDRVGQSHLQVRQHQRPEPFARETVAIWLSDWSAATAAVAAAPDRQTSEPVSTRTWIIWDNDFEEWVVYTPENIWDGLLSGNQTKLKMVTQVGQADEESRETKHDLKSLRDLRSRALLSMNTSFQTSMGADDDSDEEDVETIAANEQIRLYMQQFDQDIRMLESILDDIVELCRLGHFGFRSFSRTVAREELQMLHEHTNNELVKWKQQLGTARKDFLWLKYFRSGQLLHIHDSFRGKFDPKARTKLDSILKFASPYFNPQDNTGFDVTRVHLPVDGYAELPNAGEQLRALGQALQKVMQWTEPPKAARIIHKLDETDASSQPQRVEPGRLKVMKVADGVNTLSCIMALFLGAGMIPEANQTLFCQNSTCEEEVEMLLSRCTVAESKLHVIVNPERLDASIQTFLMEQIRLAVSVRKGEEPRGTALLALVCCEEVRGHVLGQFADCEHPYRAGNSADTTKAALREQLKMLTSGQEIVCITSVHPGLGKTELIRQHAYREGLMLRTVPVSGPMDIERLVRRLHQAELTHTGALRCALHLDISTVSSATDLNTFIFQLLVLGTVCCGTESFHLPARTAVYLEIANAGNLHDSLPVCLAFQIGEPGNEMVLHWDLNRFIVSSELDAPIQVVCVYLDALKRNTLNDNNITLDDGTQSPVPAARCIQLLQEYFEFVRTTECSFSVVDVFVRVLADQLRQFGRSHYFEVEMLRAIDRDNPRGNTSVRSDIVKALVEVAKEFATRSIDVAKSAQRRNQLQVQPGSGDADQAAAVNLAETLTRFQPSSWQDSNHLLVVFQRQMGGAISALYRDVRQVPEHIKKLLDSQPSDTAEYTKMDEAALRRELEKLVRNRREKLVIKDNYALTSGAYSVGFHDSH